MYEERKNKFSFKSFFLTLLLVILFILLLLWLFPSKWDIKKLENIQTTGTSVKNSKDSVNVSSSVFQENLYQMKDAAVSYYTDAKMPKENGKTDKLTLKEMHNKHMLLELKDSDNKSCDDEKSYAEIVKKDNEYELKVNLKCGEKEDYILTYLNKPLEYSNNTCNNQSNVESKEEQTSGKVSTYVEPEKKIYSCEIVDGLYYNKNGNSVSKVDYEKSCGVGSASSKCQVLNGKYYDPNGNMVGKDDYEKLCNTKATTKEKAAKTQSKYYCKKVNGKYYDSKGNIVNEGEYKKSCK